MDLFLDAIEAFPKLEDFVRTYERWQEQILNYFQARQTSAAVEGINNKARVITKRAYGLKSADSLWTRLLLDLNRAKEIIRYSIVSIRAMAHGLRGLFSMVCG
jgi:Transposase